MIPDEVYEAIAGLCENCAGTLEEVANLLKQAFESFEFFEKLADEMSAHIIPKVVHDTPYVPKCKIGKAMFRRAILPRARSCC